jgi:hypothetical protein
MFRIDQDTVVDATMSGGLARYINHSCSPNCTADIVQIEKDFKIIIITNRRIPKGEEVGALFCPQFSAQLITACPSLWDLAEWSERCANIPKVTGSNPCSGSELTFRSDLL